MDEYKEDDSNSNADCWESCVRHMTCSNGLMCVNWVQGCTGEANPPIWHGDGEGPLLSGGGPQMNGGSP
eukprot:scaffold16656_cov42-Attheya_sp.AAC.2